MRRTETVPTTLAAVFLLACGAPEPPSAEDAAAAARGETRGFVLSRWAMVIPATDPADCPQGFNLNYVEFEEQQGREVATDCDDPAAHPDPGYRTLDAPGTLLGLDLDGIASTLASSGPGTCPHDDFSGPGGEPGIDHQVWRAIGCVRGYQKGDQIDSTSRAAIKDGSLTILLEVTGVDDLIEDDEIQLRIFSSSDRAPLSPAGELLPGASLEVHEEQRFHSRVARGQIRDGILTTEPIDMRLELTIQVIDFEYWIRDARIRMQMRPDGTGEGVLAGYWDLENFYSVMARHYLASAAARFLGYTCPGFYAALHSQADGHPDPETGQCTSLSAAWEIEAVPAFVIQSDAPAVPVATGG
ncbi:MAG: hypothetical protein JRH19_26645 [Deltaproteobacteria bacterium]|nr:hypothetical protein [Deltaproteobacteria bacterium]